MDTTIRGRRRERKKVRVSELPDCVMPPQRGLWVPPGVSQLACAKNENINVVASINHTEAMRLLFLRCFVFIVFSFKYEYDVVCTTDKSV